MLVFLKLFIDYESFKSFTVEAGVGYPQSETGSGLDMSEMVFFIFQQFARRIIFHQPSLFMKSLDKVSFKDLVLSDDFSMEDLATFGDLFIRYTEFPLKWFKDAVLDALAMSHHGTAANVGNLGERRQVICFILGD